MFVWPPYIGKEKSTRVFRFGKFYGNSLYTTLLKGADWVDPDDPMLIAENELLGAAESIDKAARKLASLKPRKEIKGKVETLLFYV